MITCWSGRSDDLSPPPPPPPPRTRNSSQSLLSQEWKRRKVEKGVSRSAVGFAGVGGEVGRLEKKGWSAIMARVPGQQEKQC